MRRLKTTEVAVVRGKLASKQANTCPLCQRKFVGPGKVKPALDHCHVSGQIRGVLCLNCNGMEGKVFNLSRRAKKDGAAEWLQALLEYWQQPSLPLLHPTHKTDAEKRAATNKKARERRAKLKASQ